MTDDIEYWRASSARSPDSLSPAFAADLLAEIATGHRDLRAVRHPLGFLCFPLVRRPELGICVHLWAAGAVPLVLTSEVHSHSWDLTSAVLFGAVRNSVVPVFDTTARPTHRVFEVHSNGGRDEVRATPRLVRTAAATTTVSTTGEVYELPAGAFHRTDVTVSDDTATLVVGRTRLPLIDLSLGGLYTRDHALDRHCCTAEETVRVARSMTDRLSRPGTVRPPRHSDC